MSKLVFLKTEQDFERRKFRQTVNSGSFRLSASANIGQNHPRFGFIIPKKQVPQVTDRNKIKRRLKSILQKHIALIQPKDILVLPRRQSLVKPFPQLEIELISALRQSKSLKP